MAEPRALPVDQTVNRSRTTYGTLSHATNCSVLDRLGDALCRICGTGATAHHLSRSRPEIGAPTNPYGRMALRGGTDHPGYPRRVRRADSHPSPPPAAR